MYDHPTDCLIRAPIRLMDVAYEFRVFHETIPFPPPQSGSTLSTFTQNIDWSAPLNNENFINKTTVVASAWRVSGYRENEKTNFYRYTNGRHSL